MHLLRKLKELNSYEDMDESSCCNEEKETEYLISCL